MTTISLRIPVGTLERIKIEADRREMPYSALIREWLEEKLSRLHPELRVGHALR